LAVAGARAVSSFLSYFTRDYFTTFIIVDIDPMTDIYSTKLHAHIYIVKKSEIRSGKPA